MKLIKPTAVLNVTFAVNTDLIESLALLLGTGSIALTSSTVNLLPSTPSLALHFQSKDRHIMQPDEHILDAPFLKVNFDTVENAELKYFF